MKAYITLDYELFMGKNVGTIKNCLIDPMNALTKMLDNYGIKCNIFVDAAYLLRLYQLKNEFKQIEEQYELLTKHIQYLSKQGHAIQLHFHPQWLYSMYNNGWKMDFEHYKISDMPKRDIETLLPQAIELLQLYSINKIDAFRAGGYSFPNEKQFLDILRRYSIQIDTSVLKGAKVESKFQTYDYLRIPSISPYNFEDNLSISNHKGFFTEYPISTIKMIGYKYWFLKRTLNRHYNTLSGSSKYGDGCGIGIPGGIFEHIKNKINRLITFSVIPATIDGVLSLYLENVYKHNYSKNYSNPFVIIGHPKNMSEKSIKIFEDFIIKHKEMEFCLF